MGISESQLVFNIVEDNIKTESFCNDTYLSTDMTVTDDTDGLATGFVAALGILIPAATVQQCILGRYGSEELQIFTCYQFCNRTCIRIRRVEYRYTAVSGCFEINLVGTDTETTYCT